MQQWEEQLALARVVDVIDPAKTGGEEWILGGWHIADGWAWHVVD
jgi:hypothetical protein